MKTMKILNIVGLSEEGTVDNEEVDNRELFEAEIAEIIYELVSTHSDTQTYTTSVNNLKTLTEAYNNYERAVAEKDKTNVEFDKNNKLLVQKALEIVPRAIGILASAGLTYGWFLVEQGHPLANRLVNKTNDYLTRP